MANQYDEDEYYSDGGFDGLPVNALHQLERNAINVSQQALEQQQQLANHNEFSTDYGGLGRDRSNADGWQMVDEDQEMPAPPSSDYGFDDEDVIDLDDPTMIHEDATVMIPQVMSPVNQEHVDQFGDAGVEEHAGRGVMVAPEQGVDLQRLQSRITQLERERTALQESLKTAQSDVLSKDGAIAILRSKHDTATKDFERKVLVMQKLHAEEAAKQKSEIEAVRKDQETTKTNNKFLEHDLAQEMERSKRLKGASTNSVRAPPSRATTETAVTPRKTQTLPFRDGFDDHEIMAVSPSKSKDKAGTPKAGAKRKRQAEASPAISLHVSPPQNSPGVPDVHHQPDNEVAIVSKELEMRDANIRTLQRVLSHAPLTGHPRTVEALTKYTFPHMTNVSLSSLLLQGLSQSQTDKDVPVSVQVCYTCMTLWSTCLAKGYFEPLSLILDLLDFVILSETNKITSLLIEPFIPLAIKTMDLIAVPRVKAMNNFGFAASLDRDVQAKLHRFIDDNLVVSLWHTLAISASSQPETARKFWRTMEFEVVLIMLNKAQPLPHITMMLQMVASSVSDDSFGAENADIERQIRNEASTVDRLTSLLFETPQVPSGEEAYTVRELAELRVEIIRTLGTICSTAHGSRILAQHKAVIGRLIRFLELHVTSLSSLPTSSPPLTTATTTTTNSNPNNARLFPSLHDLVMTTINATTRLLYNLLHDHADLIDLRQKLAAVHGGHHKFLVAFSRLAFSERLVLEAGLDDEAVDAAHEILDAVLNSEEGAAVVQAVETPRGSTGTRISMGPPGGSAPG